MRVMERSMRLRAAAGGGQSADGVEPAELGQASGEAGRASSEALVPAGAGGDTGPRINPFWSERVQDEARLQAARPDFLGRILEDGGERGSRAIELAPTRPPRSFGPSEQGAQVRSSSEPTRKTASRAAAAHDHPREGQTAGFGVDQARGESIGSDSVEGESSGLRPGERLILTEMNGFVEVALSSE